tara:strand:- start:339 stop:464 length:126 start_codon:yes stop_codon:yes gene_type:complete
MNVMREAWGGEGEVWCWEWGRAGGAEAEKFLIFGLDIIIDD